MTTKLDTEITGYERCLLIALVKTADFDKVAEWLKDFGPAYVAGLERRVEELGAALRAVEWVAEFEFGRDDPEQAYLYSYTWCPWCNAEHDNGHAPDCPREAALAEGRRLTDS